MRKLITILCLTLFLLKVYGGDFITLNNDKVYEGKVTKIKDCMVHFKINNERFVIPATDINCIEFQDKQDNVYVKYMNMNPEERNKCLQGRLDAESYHGRTFGNIMVGFLFGVFGVIGCAVSSPVPQKNKKALMLSKNQDIFNDMEYLKCYKKRARGKNVVNSCIGWGAWIIIALTL
jgi:hypothetical protein